MSDYSDSKSYGNKAYPVETLESSNLLGRVESTLTPDQLINRYLKGIDTSDYTNDDLKTQIELAINEVELLTNLHIVKTQKRERLPFDRALYKSMVYCKLNDGPILSIEDMAVVSSNGEKIFKLPAVWVEMGHASTFRQVCLIPILSIFGATNLDIGQPSNAGLIFLNAVNNFAWLPAFFTIVYTVGVSHEEGKVPIVINELIGLTAAIEVLSTKQTQNKFNSTSIGQDGISQSSSTAGTQVYEPRINKLKEQRERIMQKIKAKFAQKYFLSNI